MVRIAAITPACSSGGTASSVCNKLAGGVIARSRDVESATA